MSTATHNTLDERVALTAAEWYFRLQEDASPEQHAACARWRAADPLHEQAWLRAEHLGKTLAGLPSDLALSTLNRKRGPNRRNAVKTLAALLCAVPAGWLAWHSAPVRERMAAHRTATGEQREILLADGSRVHLNTATALDVEYDDAQRKLYLHQGEILVDTAPDPLTTEARPARPFIVETTHGRVRALGTRFSLRHDNRDCRIAVHAGAVEIRPARATDALFRLDAGLQTRFTALGTDAPATTADRHALHWTKGRLFVREMRLADFTAELGRYRAGVLRCDPAVADLRISGAFALQDTNAILDSLPLALPVRVVYRSRFWVTLTTPDA